MHTRVGLPSGAVHEIDLEENATIKDLRNAVSRLENIDLEQKRIRLIHGGKIFSDDNIPLSECLKDGAFVHCAISDVKPPLASPDMDSLSDVLRATHQNAENPSTVIALGRGNEVHVLVQDPSARGFDRLRAAGFTDEEVSAIRRQFREAIRRRIERNGEEEGETSREEAARLLEEEWLNATGADDPSPTADYDDETRRWIATMSEGTNNDFLAGIVLGFLLGLIMIVLLLDRNLSRKWRIGILAGVGCNLSFGLLRSSLVVQGSFNPP